MRMCGAVFCLVLVAGQGIGNLAEAVEYTGHRFKDPFYKLDRRDSPPAVSQAPPSSPRGAEAYVLEGVIWNTARPMAIINGRIVEAGGRVGNAQVLKIEKEGVKIREFDREFTLSKDARKPL